ncbi:UDP-4-amino-4,6-dideoxy-N-acetyl-beta-L-altrosamine N-acetyltransferase [Pseudomonas sp. Hg5Tf]|jgi:UDP-4-amino-4,6-dideoxy-N-acetyl-beta-L-altrosamine N-acetyltransferase|uniref:UDP-4-amino-4, 6-dideoxy-N-acetyl-beta-L-altrosamine N-acetyltransferase n=1 Tax=Pseudomonas sp. Hg7Tf TaxID=3236988 RepID=A0AB39I4Q3_9PSED|nr:UDP-4-amino-4,6-dideoxy-N-acetyl-beta-L-altrosamine N-acetyltransferase [Pseudomonas sp. Hg5Tf]MDH2557795.1 UDP-4-amino-4,6-dideoxy-N-acetyl-beta-L-altrosamine N-acetyltransferase [Pseudomonas sp. Hg5Tf]
MVEKYVPKYKVRVMTSDDLERVLLWRNHPDVRRFMFTQHEISLDEHSQWFGRASKDSRKHLLIFETNNVPQGFIHVTEIGHRVADWGFYIAPDAPRGSGFQLGLAAINFAFEVVGLHKLCGQALEFNERSIKFHLRMGFQQEGSLRDQHYDGINYHTVVCFGLLEHEWKKISESIEHE